MTDKTKLDTSDPGLAADVVARASVLFAVVSGFVAENQYRQATGYPPAFRVDAFEGLVDEFFPEFSDQKNETNEELNWKDKES